MNDPVDRQEDAAFAGGLVDWLQLVSAIHRRDQGALDAVCAELRAAPTHSLVWLLECAARTYLAALAAMMPAPAMVQKFLDEQAFAALDRTNGNADDGGQL